MRVRQMLRALCHGLSSLAARTGGCLSPAMHKPRRSRPAAPPRYRFSATSANPSGPKRSSRLRRARDWNAREGIARRRRPRRSLCLIRRLGLDEAQKRYSGPCGSTSRTALRRLAAGACGRTASAHASRRSCTAPREPRIRRQVRSEHSPDARCRAEPPSAARVLRDAHPRRVRHSGTSAEAS